MEKMAGFECDFVEPPAKYLKVECPFCLHNRSKGCTLMGELRLLEDHLNENLTFDKLAESCGFTIVSCPVDYAGCKEDMLKKDLPTHVNTSLVKHTIMQMEAQHSLTVKYKQFGQEMRTNRDLVQELMERIETLESKVTELMIFKEHWSTPSAGGVYCTGF